MMYFCYSTKGSFFREKRILRMAPEQNEQNSAFFRNRRPVDASLRDQSRQQPEKPAVPNKAELKKEVADKLMEQIKGLPPELQKQILDGLMKNRDVLAKAPDPKTNLPQSVKKDSIYKDPKLQNKINKLGSTRNLQGLVEYLPKYHIDQAGYVRVDQNFANVSDRFEEGTVRKRYDKDKGLLLFVVKDGQWQFQGVESTPQQMRADTVRLNEENDARVAAKKKEEQMKTFWMRRGMNGDYVPPVSQRAREYELMQYYNGLAKGDVQSNPNYNPNWNSKYKVAGEMRNSPAEIEKRKAEYVELARADTQWAVEDRTPEQQNEATQKAINEKMKQLSKSLHVESFMLPGILGDVGDGRGGSGLSMKIMVPDEVSGIRGMNQITYMVGSGRFRTAAEETMARRAGITFLTGGGELEVHFAKPGKYAVWSEAGYDVPGPTTKRRIIHERRDFEVKGLPPVDPMQLAVEHQKYKEAGELPVGRWGKIPTAAPDGKGGVFMYRTGARNARGDYVVQAYSPNAGLSQYDNATGRWSFPGGKAFTYKEFDAEYAELFKEKQQPVVAKQPQQQPAQQPVAPMQQEKQPVQQQQPVEKKQPEKQRLSLDTFKATLDRLNIKVDEAWLKDDTWNKLNLALGSLGDEDYKLVMGRTISMPGTNFPNANGFALPNDPDQDRVNEQLRAYVDFVKKNPEPQFIQKIENVPNEEPAAEEQPAQVQPPVAEVPKNNGPVIPVPPEVKRPPVAPEKPKAGVEKNDAITVARPDLNSLLPVKYENEPIIERESQKNKIDLIKLPGNGRFLREFEASVQKNGLLLTRKEESDLRQEYNNADDDEKKRLEPVMKIIDDYLIAKVTALKEEPGVMDAPLTLPTEEQVNLIKPTNEQMKKLSDDVVAMGNKYGLDVDAIVDEKNYSSLKNNFAKVEAVLAGLTPNETNFLKAYKTYNKGELSSKIILGDRTGVSTLRIYVDVNEDPRLMAINLAANVQEMKMCVLVHSEVEKINMKWGARIQVDQYVGALGPYKSGDFQRIQEGLKNLTFAYSTLTKPQKDAINKSGYTILASNQNGGREDLKTLNIDCRQGPLEIQKMLLDLAKKNIAQA